MDIKISRRAKANSKKIIAYLQKEFGANSVSNFQSQVAHFFSLLKLFPKLGSIEDREKSIYGYSISKLTKVFYRIEAEQIIILSIFDVREDASKHR